VYVAINNCASDGTFQLAKKVINDFTYDADDWSVKKQLHSPVDLMGDGCADIVGLRGYRLPYVSLRTHFPVYGETTVMCAVQTRP
jgi:hypothetical protein